MFTHKGTKIGKKFSMYDSLYTFKKELFITLKRLRVMLVVKVKINFFQIYVGVCLTLGVSWWECAESRKEIV